jgi:hypothetical protein
VWQEAGGTLNLGYGAGAAPASFNQTGVRNFCSAEDGVIHFNVGAAGAPPLRAAQPFAPVLGILSCSDWLRQQRLLGVRGAIRRNHQGGSGDSFIPPILARTGRPT